MNLSLQLRLLLSLLALLLGLSLIAGVVLSRLSSDLQQAVAESAGAVGRRLVSVLREERVFSSAPSAGAQAPEFDGPLDEPTLALEGRPAAGSRVERHELRMVINGRELSADEVAALADAPLTQFDPEALRFELERENGPVALRVIGLGRDLQIPLPESPVQAAVQQFSARLGWGLAGLVALGLLGAWLIARHLARPLQALAVGAARLGAGERGVRIAAAGPPELKASIDAFNRMAADLERLQDDAAQRREDRALAELGEIGRGLAHSLRNPLHALGLSLESLARGRETAPEDPALAAGREQLARIDQALRGFLALAAGAGAQAQPVALAEVIDDVLLEASQRAAGRVRIERELAPLALSAVAAELRILVHTVVLNALEASPEGAVLRVRLQAGEVDEVVVEVEDAGPGLPPAVRARLFEPHVSSKPTGAGMGLFLSARLARQRYGGTIEFEPIEPQGTRVRLRLHPRRGSIGAADAH